MKKNVIARLALVALVVSATAAGIAAYAVGPIGGLCNKGIYCLDVWNPVICSNGVVYSNSCYAARACAKNCVPYGAQ